MLVGIRREEDESLDRFLEKEEEEASDKVSSDFTLEETWDDDSSTSMLPSLIFLSRLEEEEERLIRVLGTPGPLSRLELF